MGYLILPVVKEGFSEGAFQLSPAGAQATNTASTNKGPGTRVSLV